MTEHQTGSERLEGEDDVASFDQGARASEREALVGERESLADEREVLADERTLPLTTGSWGWPHAKPEPQAERQAMPTEEKKHSAFWSARTSAMSGPTLEILQPPNVTRHPASIPSCMTTSTAQLSTRDGPPRVTGRTPKPTVALQQRTEASSPQTTRVNQVARTLWTWGTEPRLHAWLPRRQPPVRKRTFG
jgi:hypothetical protein